MLRTTGEHPGGAGLAIGLVGGGGMGEWAKEGTTEKVGEFDLDQQVGVTRWASERTPSRKGA